MFSNIRLGVATNSSSTHSIVTTKEHYGTFYPHSIDQYGWEQFFLTTEDQKRRYLLGDSTVDHQSATAMPIDEEFRSDVERFLVKNKRIAIVGGSDQDGEKIHSHKISNTILNKWFAKGEDVQKTIVRKEDTGLWTIFSKSRKGWSRCTVDLKYPEEPRKFGKTRTPMLIDVKVTDFCAYGCDYCYQGSTINGFEASPHDIDNFSKWCKSNDVLEIAIGGGEPTTWRHLQAMIDSLDANGVLPNMTTRNIKWLQRNKEMVEEKMGGVAVSIDNPKTMNLLRDIPRNTSIQVVVGSTTQEEFNEICFEANRRLIGVTLLGWKYTGRGSSVSKKEVDWTKAFDCLDHIGIDTCLAKESVDILDSMKIPKYTYTIDEGLQSMYVDLVNKKAAKSSFCDETFDFVDIDDIQKIWRVI